MQNGRLVGIVSRANLIQALASSKDVPETPSAPNKHARVHRSDGSARAASLAPDRARHLGTDPCARGPAALPGARPASERVLYPTTAPGLVEPGVPHEVAPVGPVRFQVEFHRMTRVVGADPGCGSE